MRTMHRQRLGNCDRYGMCNRKRMNMTVAVVVGKDVRYAFRFVGKWMSFVTDNAVNRFLIAVIIFFYVYN